MPIIYKRSIKATYFNHGFFNVEMDYDRYVRLEEGPIDLVLLKDRGRCIKGRLDRKSNNNGAARIHGGNELLKYFQMHYKVGDDVDMDLTSEKQIVIG